MDGAGAVGGVGAPCPMPTPVPRALAGCRAPVLPAGRHGCQGRATALGPAQPRL